MLELIAVGLAGWRTASLLVEESGPWHIFERLRYRLGVRSIGEPEGFWPELFSCVFCMSVWTCAGCWALWWISHEAVLVLGAMAVAVLARRAMRE